MNGHYISERRRAILLDFNERSGRRYFAVGSRCKSMEIESLARRKTVRGGVHAVTCPVYPRARARRLRVRINQSIIDSCMDARRVMELGNAVAF